MDKLREGSCYAIGIDLGTSGPKVALVDDSGNIIASARGHIDTLVTDDGGAEQDPNQWWIQVKKIIRDIVRDSGVFAGDIVGIGTNSMWSSVVPVDEHGDPLMNALLWMDSRGAPYNASIVKGFPSVKGYGLFKTLRWLKTHGCAPVKSGIDDVGHINFIRHERPDVYGKTFKFLEPMDFLISRLTGVIAATQSTMFASVSVDNNTWGVVEYCDELLKLSGIDRAKLPDLVPNDAVVGTLLPSVAEELGLSPLTRVVTGMNDNMSAAIGAGVVHDFEGTITIGTSLVMTGHVPFKKTDLAHLILTIPSPLKDRYNIMGVQGAGGRNIEFFIKNLLFPGDILNMGPMSPDIFDRLDSLASQAPPGCNGTMYLPWATGTVVPEENPHARAVFFNLGMNTMRTHMCRAIMEGIAFNNRWTKGPMEKFTGRAFTGFRVSGGGALSPTFCQILADVLAVPIHQIVDPLITCARGAALNAFMILGYRSKDEIPGLVKVQQTFEPNEANHSVYDRQFLQFLSLQKRTKPVFNALNASPVGVV